MLSDRVSPHPEGCPLIQYQTQSQIIQGPAAGAAEWLHYVSEVPDERGSGERESGLIFTGDFCQSVCSPQPSAREMVAFISTSIQQDEERTAMLPATLCEHAYVACYVYHLSIVV